jgi:hypothetical protein
MPREATRQWIEAAKQLDDVTAALFEGDFIAALRRARVAARQLRDTVGPEHPEHAALDAIAKTRSAGEVGRAAR